MSVHLAFDEKLCNKLQTKRHFNFSTTPYCGYKGQRLHVGAHNGVQMDIL